MWSNVAKSTLVLYHKSMKSKFVKKSKRKYLKALCKICGDSYTYYLRNPKPSEQKLGITGLIPTAKACKASCASKLRAIEKGIQPKLKIVCERESCTNVRIVKPSAVIRKGVIYPVYCSHQCSTLDKIKSYTTKQRLDKRRRYSTGWYTARNKALLRDNYTCQRCKYAFGGKHRNLTVHHITPITAFKNPSDKTIKENIIDHLDNLVSLCRKCHGTVETKGIDFLLPFSSLKVASFYLKH